MEQKLHTPEGVRDIYNRECAIKLALQKKLNTVLHLYGYQDIQTPTFEYFDVFSREIGTTPSKDLYKFFDKDGSIAGKYRKMHIPDDPAYYEKFYFTPGDLGFEPIQTSLGKLGVQVCWDQWYPEGARLMALKGAEILIYPTAIGWESTDTQEEKIRQLDAWVTVQRGHAVANGLPVIAVNRVGHEPDPSGQTNGIQFWGNSFVAGPQGEILVQASNMDEENMVVELDMTRSENVRRWWPFLRDRRIDKFENLTRRFID